MLIQENFEDIDYFILLLLYKMFEIVIGKYMYNKYKQLQFGVGVGTPGGGGGRGYSGTLLNFEVVF